MSDLEQQISIEEIMCVKFKVDDNNEDVCEITGMPIDREYCKSMGHYYEIDCLNYNNQ